MGTKLRHKKERKRAKRARQQKEHDYQMHLRLKGLKHGAGPKGEIDTLRKMLGI